MAVGEADTIGSRQVKAADSILPAFAIPVRHSTTLWAPVLLAAGIAAYFAKPSEPEPLLCLAVSLAAAAGFLWGRTKVSVLFLAIVATGFVLAKIRADWTGTPLVRAFVAEAVIEGHVSDSERRGAGAVIWVDVASVLGILPAEQPRRIRFTARRLAQVPLVGDKVRIEGKVAPLPRPVAPGGFDYGRMLYFQSAGATGEIVRAEVLEQDNRPLRYWLRRSFHDLRLVIGERIAAVISGPLGSFAEAIITGERASIPRAMNESLQQSGLFHILSISGLHMSLVAGGMFWLVRALLALSPFLALNFPIKKWAAVAAMVTGLFYMLLADSGAATERSYIMIAVMFFAILVDRPAISMRNLAVAAIFILVTEPEQVLSASFQMSFMAVMGIAAFFEWFNGRPVQPSYGQASAFSRVGKKALNIVFAALATSLIAGTLSSIPASYHFGRLAPFSVVSNAMAIPLTSFVIMPAALLGTLLMPLGLEYVPLIILEQGLSLLMAISDWVSSWDGAGLVLPQLSAGSAVLLAVAAAFTCIAPSRFKLAALPLIAAAIVAGSLRGGPDLIIEERARNVAVRNDDGELAVALPTQTRFAVQRWLREEGDISKPAALKRREGWRCDEVACSASVQGMDVTYMLRAAEERALCRPADILISAYPLKRRCKGRKLTIDRFDVWRHGAAALRIDGGTISVTTARGVQGKRPWVAEPRARQRLAARK